MRNMMDVIRDLVVFVKPPLKNTIFDNDTSFWDLGFTALDYSMLISYIEASYEIDFVEFIRKDYYRVDSVSKICDKLMQIV